LEAFESVNAVPEAIVHDVGDIFGEGIVEIVIPAADSVFVLLLVDIPTVFLHEDGAVHLVTVPVFGDNAIAAVAKLVGKIEFLNDGVR
jgi:hypothetical protein